MTPLLTPPPCHMYHSPAKFATVQKWRWLGDMHHTMSTGSNTGSGNNSNGTDRIDWQRIALPDLLEQVENSLKVQIAKFDEQSCHRHDKLMKWAAEQEVQRKAEEGRKKAEEEAKRVAKEEVKRLAEEEAKKKAEEDTQKRAEFQAWWQAKSERKVKENAEAKAVAKLMRVQIVQKAVQGKKPKLKVCGMELFSSFLLLTYSFNFSNIGGQSVCTQRGSPGVVPPMQLMLEEWWQQGMLQQCTDTDLQSVSKNESQVLLRGVDGNDEEVGQWWEVQGEWDIGNRGHDIAVRGQKA